MEGEAKRSTGPYEALQGEPGRLDYSVVVLLRVLAAAVGATFGAQRIFDLDPGMSGLVAVL